MIKEPCGRPDSILQASFYMNETHVVWNVADGRILRP